MRHFVLATFSGDTVERIAAEACPNFPLVADAARVAEAMNEAAGHLPLSIQTTAPIAEAQRWAGRFGYGRERISWGDRQGRLTVRRQFPRWP